MSYNPAFVADESPLAHANGADHDQSNGIKLISFKVLPKASTTSQPPQEALQLAAADHHHHHHHPLQQSKQDVVLDITKNQQRQHSSSIKRRSSSSRQQQQQVSSFAQSKLTNSSVAAATVAAAAAKHAAQNVNKPQNQIKASTALKASSASSSLSLIDNPTLSSLTPSASSYSTTSSSIVSSSGLCAAVECRDMRYDVGRGRNQKTILHNINVTVPEGSIYGLLGPSGCGKTTMLRCVVGRIKPKEGYVRVFGYKPNDSGSQIPGPAIGYMPQVSLTFFFQRKEELFKS